MSKKGDEENHVFRALERLMAEPGTREDMWSDVLRHIYKDEPELAEIVESLPNHSDRDAALIYGAMVENYLERAIATHFVSGESTTALFSYRSSGPLATFAAKIQIGYALGVYEERMRSDLRWIKNIRNAFAHVRKKIDFSTPAIADACSMLTPRGFPKMADGTDSAPPPGNREVYAMNATLIADFLGQKSNPDTLRRFTDSHLYYAIYGLPLPRRFLTPVTERRREATLKQKLATPHKPKKPSKAPKSRRKGAFAPSPESKRSREGG